MSIIEPLGHWEGWSGRVANISDCAFGSGAGAGFCSDSGLAGLGLLHGVALLNNLLRMLNGTDDDAMMAR